MPLLERLRLEILHAARRCIDLATLCFAEKALAGPPDVILRTKVMTYSVSPNVGECLGARLTHANDAASTELGCALWPRC